MPREPARGLGRPASDGGGPGGGRGRWRSFRPRRPPTGANVPAAALLSAWALGCVPPAAGQTALLNDMPCSTHACPQGYHHRWNAADVLCANGPCDTNDTQTCCTLGRFTSYMWRVQASNVTEEWEVARVRFFLDDDCSPESEATTAPGLHGSFDGWPSGIAFSHHFGHGGMANKAFALDPAPTPRQPVPVRPTWVSSGPCDDGVCYIGFNWEEVIDRFPVGTCASAFKGGCTSESKIKRAGFLRIGCAEVEQSTVAGRYAETLRLQFLEPDARLPATSDANDTSTVGVWRTAAIAQGLLGGLAHVQINPTNASNITA